MVKEVRAFMTDDGVMHKNLKDAENHELYNEFYKYYYNQARLRYGSDEMQYVGSPTMFDWLQENKEFLKKFIKKL